MVMSVESGEWAHKQVIQAGGGRGTSCKAEGQLNSLSPAYSDRAPAPCSSTSCPTAQMPPGRTPSFLGPDTSEKETDFYSELYCVYNERLSQFGIASLKGIPAHTSLHHLLWAECFISPPYPGTYIEVLTFSVMVFGR